jgi:hypothetical protein
MMTLIGFAPNPAISKKLSGGNVAKLGGLMNF